MTDMTPMLDCDAVMRQLWDYIDGELTEERMATIRAHLVLCARCQPQHEFELTFLKTLARVRSEHSNLGSVRERVMAALHNEGFAAA